MNNSPSYHSFMKSPNRSIKHTTYFAAYDELFSSYRDKEITFVEIGVLGGGSLFMWRDFFGPKARIIGIDLNPGAKKLEEEGFEIFIGSQTDETFWSFFKQKIGQIDILLDDGGHTFEQQIVTTENMLENIKDGGLLVVEDTHTSYMKGFGPNRYSFIEYTKKIFDNINQRFSKLDTINSEKRIWSLHVYESIIAFKVNRELTNIKSEGIANEGKHDHAGDYRFGKPGTLNKSIKKRVYRFFPSLFFNAKKYFK